MGLTTMETGITQSVKKNTNGFTLIEITAALAILIVGILSILALYPVGLVASKRSEEIFIATKQAQQVMAELVSLQGSNPPFVTGATLRYQKKFHSDEFFYLYRVEDLSATAIPGDGTSYPTDMFYVRVAVYTSDRYAGGTPTNPTTPSGKAIETFSCFLAGE